MKNKKHFDQWRFKRLLSILPIILTLLFLTADPSASLADTLTVINTNDSGSGSLRQAILNAQPDDEIVFSPSLSGHNITLTSGKLIIDKNLSITGLGADQLTITSMFDIESYIVFDINSSAFANISCLTIEAPWINGISNHGTLTISECEITNTGSTTLNTAIKNYGNLNIADSKVTRSEGFYGAIFNSFGALNITNSTISENVSIWGAIYSEGGTLTITNSKISKNRSENVGGITNNGGTAWIINSMISENMGLESGSGTGGIRNYYGTMEIISSTINNNVGKNTVGGIYNNGLLKISNSTISENTAMTRLGIISSGSLEITNSTIAGNSCQYGITGDECVGIAVSGSSRIKNSIVANDPLGVNCIGSFLTHGINFSTDDTCGAFTQVTSSDLNLAPLSDNGGPTTTQALLPGSLAIDASVDCTILGGSEIPIKFDQRGDSRPKDGDKDGEFNCDIGAYEFGNPLGDFDEDWDVDGTDLSYITSAYSSIIIPTLAQFAKNFGRNDWSVNNKTVYLELFDNYSDSWIIEGNEYINVESGIMHMKDESDSDYVRYVHPGLEPFQIDIPDVYTWSSRLKFPLNGAVGNISGTDTRVSNFIYNGKGSVVIAFSELDGVCLLSDTNSWECIPSSSSFIEEHVWHNWYMIVDSTNDPVWSIDIYRDSELIASNLNVYVDINDNDGRFGIENRGLSTDVAETYWDWYRIEVGAHPPLN